MSKQKNALGKGLSALIGDNPVTDSKQAAANVATATAAPKREENSISAVLLPLDKLSPGRFQPRGYFDEEKLKELTVSIKENGVLQPILARPEGVDKYQIIAGERRWRASRQAGLATIPVIIKEMSDKQALEVALIENIQRQSLTAIEEAEGYKKLIEEFSYTQEQLAQGVGKSRSHITNMLRLLQLPQEVKDLINTGSLSMGHARALVNAENPNEMAHEIIRKGLSVREAEKFAAGSGRKSTSSTTGKTYSPARKSVEKDEDLIALEQVLSKNMGIKVTVEDSSDGGKVTLYFSNLSELDKILQKLN